MEMVSAKQRKLRNLAPKLVESTHFTAPEPLYRRRANISREISVRRTIQEYILGDGKREMRWPLRVMRLPWSCIQILRVAYTKTH